MGHRIEWQFEEVNTRALGVKRSVERLGEDVTKVSFNQKDLLIVEAIEALNEQILELDQLFKERLLSDVEFVMKSAADMQQADADLSAGISSAGSGAVNEKI